jgi:periplasmic mercuric ion binding protein
MKAKFIMMFAILAFIGSTVASAQVSNSSKAVTIKTETIKVSGNCGSCKARIEKAAKTDGVSKADWSDETKLLTVVYDSNKVTIDNIEKKIAAVGHDTPKYKADQKAYDNLPGCCKYR